MTQLELTFEYTFTVEEVEHDRFRQQRELFRFGRVPVTVWFSDVNRCWGVTEGWQRRKV